MSLPAARPYCPISGGTTYPGIPAPKPTVAPLGQAASPASPAVVCCHDKIAARCPFPEHRGGEVNGNERSELGRHGLGGAVEDNRINLDKFEKGDERQDDRASCCDLAVAKTCPEPQAIQCRENDLYTVGIPWNDVSFDGRKSGGVRIPWICTM
jgi:hypothetical protein